MQVRRRLEARDAGKCFQLDPASNLYPPIVYTYGAKEGLPRRGGLTGVELQPIYGRHML